MEHEDGVKLAETWDRHSTFRVVLPAGEKEIPVVPNYGWTFSMYAPPRVLNNPNLEVRTELESNQVVLYHGKVKENWDNEVYCFSLLHSPNTQFFIYPSFFDCLVPIPAMPSTKRGIMNRYRR